MKLILVYQHLHHFNQKTNAAVYVHIHVVVINLLVSELQRLLCKNKKAIGLMAQLMKLCKQHLSCLRRCFCFSS